VLLMAPEMAQITPEVCILKHEIVDTKIEGLECEIKSIKDSQAGIRDEIREVRDLQKTILYAIIGLFGTGILTLIGVVAGRAIDFRLFFP
jgi:hypothetical protein